MQHCFDFFQWHNLLPSYRVNNKRSFIDKPYLFFADAFFVYNYTHYQAISVTNAYVRRQFYQTLLKLPGAFNLQLLY